MADAKKGAKPAPKAEKPAAKKGLVESVKSAAKSVVDAVTHPKETIKRVEKAAEKAIDDALHIGGTESKATPRTEHARGRKRTLDGFVRSDKMDKTVVVEVVSLKRDPVYGKYLKDRMRYKAHDEKNEYKTGDKVQISEHRPLSRGKRWIVSKLIQRAKVE